MADDPAVLAERAEDAAREQRWNAFVAWLRELSQHGTTWVVVAWRLADAMGDYLQSDEDHVVTDFAESEGWPAVFTALGRAMREDERAKRELMDRR